mgnify:CR=1 FL=1
MRIKLIRSTYAIIMISQLLGWIYIMEKVVMGASGGMFHLGLLFIFPSLFVVAWGLMISDIKEDSR